MSNNLLKHLKEFYALQSFFPIQHINYYYLNEMPTDRKYYKKGLISQNKSMWVFKRF